MQNVIIVVYLIVVVALVIVVLLQRSEGGLGLGGGGSSGVGGLMTGRGQANALTRTTAILGGTFFVLSLVLAIMANGSRQPKSILDTVPGATAPSTTSGATPSKGAPPAGQSGVLDELRKIQGEPTPSQTPAQPQVPTSR
jgi:preprotein translocase subunit SecG